MDTNYNIYCLSFKNPNRKAQMENRFKQLDINCIFYDGVDNNDPRIANNNGDGGWSIMFGALDIIQKFYDSEKEFGIFCEDDVYIHKDFKIMLPDIIEDFKKMNLDILLLGYLIPIEIKSDYQNFEFKSNDSNLKYTYHNYPDDLWGGQMYMLTKKHAKYLLEKYTIEYANSSLTDSMLNPFSADWTITKDGNRALIYPMLAVETADKIYGHYGQDTFHENCKNCNYKPDIYI
jgi:GR25 family glycosyltransferase involved in LPS biosynthesis